MLEVKKKKKNHSCGVEKNNYAYMPDHTESSELKIHCFFNR